MIIDSIKRLFNKLGDRTVNPIDISKIKYKESCLFPKVSIIIPVYNARKYIDRCLYYLINQTLEDIEIIFVDDGSTDESIKIVREAARKDGRIKIIEQPHRLQGYARNRGIESAKGEFIGFCDADDWVDKNYYEKLYEAAKRSNSDIACAINVRISNIKYKPRLHFTEEETFTTINGKFNACNLHKNECPTNKIYKRDYLRKNNILFPEGVYCEDKLFSLKAVYYANKLTTVPGVHYYYWQNPDSTVNRVKTKKHIEDKITAKRAVLAFAKKENMPLEDNYFKAEKNSIKILGLPLFTIKENLKTESIYLFGIIKLYTKMSVAASGGGSCKWKILLQQYSPHIIIKIPLLLQSRAF